MEPLYILKWHQEMGILDLIDENPVNSFARKNNKIKIEKPANDSLENNIVETKQINIKSPANAILDTKKLALQSNSLKELKEAVTNFDGLAITRTATNTVFADGNPESRIMFIGEAPGADEDKQGIPFCGQSGQLLSQILSYVGLIREKNYYITNSIFWRPPGNRRPTPEELAVCQPFVEKHIALIKPELIVLVGSTAISSVLNKSLSITKVRGQLLDYTNQFLNGTNIKVMPTLHPSYLLRSPGQKKYAWQDALKIKLFLEGKLQP